MWGYLVVFGCFLLPSIVEASVYISEIAWMGDSDSANHEWIELHNTDSATDITGWTITDETNLSIKLEGVINSDDYVVLERTSDDSVKGDAFLIYTGALVNTGTTLYLKKADGSLVDQVSGGENWEAIGGDNATKETAQYTESGWVTAAATPGEGLNWTKEEVAAADDTETKTITTKSSSNSKSDKGETVRLILPDVTLVLEIDAQKVGYVNQEIAFSVEPSGIGDTLIDSLQYEWNFGDGNSVNNKEPKHIFEYPGTYVVVVYAGYKRQEQVARHEITILPVEISLTTNRSGDVQVNNDSPYEIDISGYKLISDETFVFPARSVLLPNQTITVNKGKLGQTDNRLVALYDTEGLVLNSIIPDELIESKNMQEEKIEKPTPYVSYISTSRQTMTDTDFVFVDNEVEVENDGKEELAFSVATSSQTASLSSSGTTSSEKWPYLALAGVLFVSTIGVYIKPKNNENKTQTPT